MSSIITSDDPPTPPLTLTDDSSADDSCAPTLSTKDNNSSAIARPSLKRKHSPLPTPPLDLEELNTALLSRAVHVLSTEASALSFVTNLYTNSSIARNGLVRAVDAVVKAHSLGGKLIVCGVGKSGIVGGKLVATLKSLGVGTSFLHAAEAVHGDMGDIRRHDVLLFVTYSGRTEELMRLSRHVEDDTPVIVVTGYSEPGSFSLLADREDLILLPAPVHEKEEVSFGVCAPTTSTTVAMAVGDMLALCVADKLHEDGVGRAFQRNHPGGAIGERGKGAVKKR